MVEMVSAQKVLEIALERAAAYVKMGFTAVKFDPAEPAQVNAPQQLILESLENAEALIKSVWEAVGDKCDILIDLGRVGGIIEAKKITGMSETYCDQIVPYLYTDPVEDMADIQIDICSPDLLVQESIGTFGGFHAEIPKEPIQWEEWYIIPPTKSGIGIELNEGVVKKPYKGD